MAPDKGASGARRHSRADDPQLLSDQHARTVAEARNALRQFDETLAIIRWYVEHRQPFQLRPSQIKTLHRLALDGLSPYAARYRDDPAEIDRILANGADRANAIVEPVKQEAMAAMGFLN